MHPKCKACGKAFHTKTRSIRYCSEACRTEARRRLNLEYNHRYMADPAKRAIVLARTRAAAAARRARMRGGRPPPPPPPLRGMKKGKPTTCGLCGRTFAPTGRGRRAAYCKRCTAKADREIRREMTVHCKACGKAFATASRSVRYCSDECSAEGRRMNDRESMRRRSADPERRAARAARIRARNAAYRSRNGG